jgi:hypothetical protein
MGSMMRIIGFEQVFVQTVDILLDPHKSSGCSRRLAYVSKILIRVTIRIDVLFGILGGRRATTMPVGSKSKDNNPAELLFKLFSRYG